MKMGERDETEGRINYKLNIYSESGKAVVSEVANREKVKAVTEWIHPVTGSFCASLGEASTTTCRGGGGSHSSYHSITA